MVIEPEDTHHHGSAHQRVGRTARAVDRTSGLYTDDTATIDLEKGLPPTRVG
ncbi:hypothetical protein [Cryobacterium sp. Hb1]|uniref:hypothetical protein n=1 Tax=Cryobacterium sp. Hb1 TaxID=1259147 RepID=UPI0018E0712D